MTDATDASEPSSSKDGSENSPSSPPVVGARVIVDVLRHFAGIPPETVQLTPLRNKAAHFVLEKSLLKIEQQAVPLTFPVPQMAVASTLHQFARNEKKILYMSQADWGAAKLIDVIFDGVIDQGKLDPEAIWLLNRFRLPLFHAVLGDFSFFFARQNLARRFINAVTLHLLTTREPFARDLKFVLGGIATRMHESFEQGTGKFNALCVEGQTWFATQQQRLQKAELKVREHVESRSRKQAAEERVIQLLNRCIADKSLPTMLIDFILSDWRQLLLWTSTKEGEQGINWKRQSRLTESMVEFAIACQSPEGRDQYQKFLPSLMKGLQASLIEMLENKERVSHIMEPVELVLNALVMGAMPAYSTHASLPLSENGGGAFEVVLESNPAMERIMALQTGQWVRFRTQDRQYEACTLVLKGEGGEPWRFINQTGQGVVSKTPAQLGQLLASGVLEIVGEGNAIDECMNRVIAQAVATLPRPAERTAGAPSVGSTKAAASVSPPRPPQLVAGPPVAEPSTAALPESPSEVAKAPSAEPISARPAVAPLKSESKFVHDVLSPAARDGMRASDVVRDDTRSEEPADSALAALDSVLRETEEMEESVEAAAEAPALPEVMQAASAAVDGLQIGARLIWYKSQDEDIALKLAAKIRSTDKLVFVNHVGIKTLDIDRISLAGLIASGRIVIIDIGTKFDSALERIVKHIQQDKK